MITLERAKELWHFLGWSSYGNDVLEEVIGHYGEPHRRYHTLNHILSMLTLVQHEKPAVILATWLHDVIYDPQRSDNEEKSAEFAGQFLEKVDRSKEFILTVWNMILDTKTHRPSSRESEQLLDADLSILAAPEVVYARYAFQIREEYSFVPFGQYCEGRTKLLAKFLERAQTHSLFFTNIVPYPEQAVINLSWELALLEQ